MDNPIVEHIKTKPGTVDDALRSLHELVESPRDAPDSWENPALERYLEAMTRWLEDMKDRVGDKPCWELFAIILQAGKIYE